MLERVVAYVEPASQVFFQRADTPLRSSRVLTSGFFTHGLKRTETPLWWPYYLENVRQIPQTSTDRSRKVRSCQDVQFGRRKCQSRVGRAILKTQLSKGSSKARSYSATASVKQDDAAAVNSQRPDDFSFWSFDADAHAGMMDVGVQSPFSHIDGQGSSLPKQHQHQHQTDPAQLSSSIFGSSDATKPKRNTAHVDLEEILGPAGSTIRDPTTVKHHKEVWKLFIALPDQRPYASRVVDYLAASENQLDQRRSVLAFETIPLEDRTKENYANVIDVAGKRKNPLLMLSICKEAKERGMDEVCRQKALLFLLRRGLWKRAAELWEVCWDESGRMHPKAGYPRSGYLHESALHLIDGALDLPSILIRLCTQLKKSDTFGVDRVQRSILLDITDNLSWRLVASGRLMSVITLEGILRIFDELTALDLLKHEHLVTAIQTLSSGMKTTRIRHEMAVALYRNNYLRFPDRQMSPHILHGLVYLCYKAEENLEAFEYLLEELRARPREGPQVLPTRADYVGALRAMAFQGNADAVNKLYKDFLADHERLRDVREAVPALYVHAVLGNVTATQEAFDSLYSRFGFIPNTICWNIVIFAHARSPEPQNAFKTYDDMLQANVQPDGYTFATIISICARVGDVENVLSFLDKATQRGIKDIRFMLSSLVRAYCMNDEIEQAEILVANLSQFEMEGSPVPIWNELLKHHAYRSDEDAVRTVRKQMQAAGVEPDEYTYGAVLATLIRTGQTTLALQMLRSLHFGSRVAATPFLYGLILHGFQREGNDDMVNVIYRELEARFPKTSPSARLSKLRSEVRRDINKTSQYFLETKTPGETHRLEVKEALAFLESLDQHNNKDGAGKAVKSPQPGFVREALVDAVPSMYSATIAETLALYGKPTQARGVLDWVDQTRPANVVQRPESVRMLTSRLLVAREQLLWNGVDDLWREILQQGLRVSISPLLLRQKSVNFAVQASKPEVVMNELLNVLQASRLTILPAQRFALSVPLTRYMISLDRQNRHAELTRVVDLFQALGFRLTGSNWNVFVQCLCGSSSREDRLAAFSVFANVLLPFMSVYTLIDKGRWIDPTTFKAFRRQEREKLPSLSLRVLARVHPEVTPPSYITTVYLARLLLDFEQLAQKGDDTLIKAVQSKHPEAFERILDLPRLPDKVQRVLLLNKRPHAPRKPASHRGIASESVLGSKSILGRRLLSKGDRETALGKSPRSHTGWTKDSMLEDIARTQEALGEISQEPLYREKEDRWETPGEQSNRFSKTMLEYLKRIDDLEKMLEIDTVVIGEDTGEPVVSPIWNIANFSVKNPDSDERLLRLALNRIPERRQSETVDSVSRPKDRTSAPPESSEQSKARVSKTDIRTNTVAAGLASKSRVPRGFAKIMSSRPTTSKPFSTSCKVCQFSRVVRRDQAARVGHVRVTPGHVAGSDSKRLDPDSRVLVAEPRSQPELTAATPFIPIRRIEASFSGLRPKVDGHLEKRRTKELAHICYVNWLKRKAASNRPQRPKSKAPRIASKQTNPRSDSELQETIGPSKSAFSKKSPAQKNAESDKSESGPGSVNVDRMKLLIEFGKPLRRDNIHAASQTQAQMPMSNVAHKMALYRKLLPPRRDSYRIHTNFNIPKARRREHGRKMIAENTAAEAISSEDVESRMVSSVDVPVRVREVARRLEEMEETSFRKRRAEKAKEVPRRRVARSFSSSNSLVAAETSWQSTAQQRPKPKKGYKSAIESSTMPSTSPDQRNPPTGYGVKIPRQRFEPGSTSDSSIQSPGVADFWKLFPSFSAQVMHLGSDARTSAESKSRHEGEGPNHRSSKSSLKS